MNYFMETIELKGQYSHYENENRRLHIHLNKLIKMNREKMNSQNFVRQEEDDSTFDLNKKNDQNPNDHNISYDGNQVDFLNFVNLQKNLGYRNTKKNCYGFAMGNRS